jgi:hypothetical protein
MFLVPILKKRKLKFLEWSMAVPGCSARPCSFPEEDVCDGAENLEPWMEGGIGKGCWGMR